MMKVFVISLATSVERRKHMVKHLTARGVDFELVDGVVGRELTDEQVAQYCDMESVRANKWMTKGFIGACLSHFLLYRRIVEENIPAACILEDDVLVGKDFAQQLAALDKTIQDDQLMLLHYTSWNKIELEDLHRPMPGKSGIYNIRNTAGLNSAAGYVLSREAAGKIAGFVFPLRYGNDNWQRYVENGFIKRVLCIFPRPVNVRYVKSSIDYVSDKSLTNRISSFIEKNKIFPFYQLLRYRRIRMNKKMDRIEIIG